MSFALPPDCPSFSPKLVMISGKGRTVFKFPLVIASPYNIPFLLLDEGKGKRIHGEVYSVDAEKLIILDELEAYPKLYTREKKDIELDDGSHVAAWIYMLPQWRDSLFDESTEMLDNYSSKGAHGREYVERYIRAKEMLEEEFNLFAWIKNQDSDDPKTLEESLDKARKDLCSHS